MGSSCATQSVTNAQAESDKSVSPMQRVRQFRCFGIATVEAIGFWSAVVIPVPLVLSLADGVGTQAEFGFVATLLVANLVAFYIGHGYGQSQSQAA